MRSNKANQVSPGRAFGRSSFWSIGYKNTTLNKPKILIFTDWYEPGFQAGGPIRSLVNLVQKLPFDFWVVTSNQDHNAPAPYKDIEPNIWTRRLHGEQVIYLDRAHQNRAFIQSLLAETKPDILYFNSLFSPRFTLLPLIIRRKWDAAHKCILAPRGMLKRGALSKKKWKKKLFLGAARLMGLYKEVIWHATNEEEAGEIRFHFGHHKQIRIAANLSVATPVQESLIDKHRGKLRLFAMSRVSAEKNIVGGIRFLQTIDRPGTEVQWDIFGTLEDPSYLEECQTEAKNLQYIKVNFKGQLAHEAIAEKTKDYHFLFLPTLGENYGHAIAESFLNARPVVISDRTPWQNLADEKVGWALPLNEEDWHNCLLTCVAMENPEFQQLCLNAFEKGKHIADDPIALRANQDLFLN